MPPTIPTARLSEGWFYLGMALTTAAIAIAGFAPALLDPTGRKTQLTWAVAAHGALFGAWLLLFILQTALVQTGRVALHRRLGYAAAVTAGLMVVTAYACHLQTPLRFYPTAKTPSGRETHVSRPLEIRRSPAAPKR